MVKNRPDYGIDAPGLIGRFFGIGLLGLGLGAASILALKLGLPPWLRFAIGPFLGVGLSFLVTAGLVLWGSKIGKLRLRDKVMNAMVWRGDEQVLDVGC